MARAHHDLVVIGGGPGGYAAALRAAQLGLRVVCVDDRERLGGTCLNVGCIPSKALLDSSERFRSARDVLGEHGVRVGDLSLDLAAMRARADRAVETLTDGIDGLFEKRGVERQRGRGRLAGEGRVEVQASGGDAHALRADHVLLATGSVAAPLPGVEIDEEHVLSSTGALALEEVPEALVVIGAGYIGLELGSVWSRLGARVTCVEQADRILPGMDRELAEALQPVLEEQGLDFALGVEVEKVEAGESGVTVRTRPAEGEGEGRDLEASHVLVAVGRSPASGDLGLEEAGVATDERGFVRTGERFRTGASGVYAVGDLAGEPMLAHKAQDEGVACVEAIAGRGPGWVNRETVPSIVYTHPEVASVGRSEEALEEAGIAYRVGRFPFRHNGRAVCTGETAGFVKILADAERDTVLGAHLIGADAGTLAHEIVLAGELGGSVEELGRTVRGHPTTNEAVREAALAAHDRALHR